MTCAAWAYRFVAVVAGLIAASFYAIEHASPWDPPEPAGPEASPSAAEDVATLVIAIAVPMVLIALREVAGRAGPRQAPAWIFGSAVWSLVAIAVGLGRWHGGADAVTTFDITVVALGCFVVTVVLVIAAGNPANLPYSPSTDD